MYTKTRWFFNKNSSASCAWQLKWLKMPKTKSIKVLLCVLKWGLGKRLRLLAMVVYEHPFSRCQPRQTLNSNLSVLFEAIWRNYSVGGRHGAYLLALIARLGRAKQLADCKEDASLWLGTLALTTPCPQLHANAVLNRLLFASLIQNSDCSRILGLWATYTHTHTQR